MSGKLFATPAEDAAYEIGYADGGNSGNADWIFMVTEEFDLDDADVNDPESFIHALRSHYDITKRSVASGSP